mgnify:CR=1 FL=1
MQTVCRSRLRPAPPDAHSPSAFPAEWRHESTGEHAPSSRCAQPRVSGCNPGIRPSSGILGTRLRTPGRWLRPLFPCIRREGSAAGRLLRCGRHKGTNLAPPRCMLFPSRTRSCLFYKYSSTQDGKILLGRGALREKISSWFPFLCAHGSLLRIAIGCSMSMPDRSQSNCCQVRFRTSFLFLGHRYRPRSTSRRLYSRT